MKKYFHKISQEEIDRLVSENKDWKYIMDTYKQPDWCTYPKALEGQMGCWSLIDIKKDGLRTKISKKFCKNCYCFKIIQPCQKENTNI